MRHMHFLDSPYEGQPFEPHVPEQLLALLPPSALQRLELDARAEVSQPVLQALPHLAPSLTMLEIRCAGSELSTLPAALLQLPQLRDLVCEGACLPDGMLPAVLALTALKSLHLECWSMDEPLPHCDQLTTLQRLTYLYVKDYTWHYEGEPLRVPAPADFSPALATLHFVPNTYDTPGGRVFQVRDGWPAGFASVCRATTGPRVTHTAGGKTRCPLRAAGQLCVARRHPCNNVPPALASLQIGSVQFSLTEYSHDDEDGSAELRVRYLRGGGPGALAALLPPGTNKLGLTLEYCELTPELFAGVSRLASLSSLELTWCNEEALVPAVLALLEQAPGGCDACAVHAMCRLGAWDAAGSVAELCVHYACHATNAQQCTVCAQFLAPAWHLPPNTGLEYLSLGDRQRLPGDPSESLLQLVAAAPALRSLWETSGENFYRESFVDSVVDRLLEACPRLCNASFMDMSDSHCDAYERFQAALAARREAAGSEA